MATRCGARRQCNPKWILYKDSSFYHFWILLLLHFFPMSDFLFAFYPMTTPSFDVVTLPFEICCEIFQYIPHRDLLQCIKVSHQWRESVFEWSCLKWRAVSIGALYDMRAYWSHIAGHVRELDISGKIYGKSDKEMAFVKIGSFDWPHLDTLRMLHV